jgi:hypothetical protein
MARRSRARDLSFSWCSLTEQSTVALYSDSMSNHPGPICRTTPSPRLGVSIWVRGCIGLILACIGCWNALPTAQAGCSGLHESFVRWVETKPTRLLEFHARTSHETMRWSFVSNQVIDGYDLFSDEHLEGRCNRLRLVETMSLREGRFTQTPRETSIAICSTGWT